MSEKKNIGNNLQNSFYFALEIEKLFYIEKLTNEFFKHKR